MKATPVKTVRALCFVATFWIFFGHTIRQSYMAHHALSSIPRRVKWLNQTAIAATSRLVSIWCWSRLGVWLNLRHFCQGRVPFKRAKATSTRSPSPDQPRQKRAF
jgi:hypothetical protein